MARTLAATGKAEQAIRLMAATDHLREVERTVPPSPEDVEWRDQYVAIARGLLEAGAWEKAWRAGQAMTLQQAVAYALSGAVS